MSVKAIRVNHIFYSAHSLIIAMHSINDKYKVAYKITSIVPMQFEMQFEIILIWCRCCVFGLFWLSCK